MFLRHHAPGGYVEPDNWYSTYRSIEAEFYTDRIMCQECKEDIGAYFPDGPGGRWTVPIRFIQSPTDIEKRQKVADGQRREYELMKMAKLQIMDREEAV